MDWVSRECPFQMSTVLSPFLRLSRERIRTAEWTKGFCNIQYSMRQKVPLLHFTKSLAWVNLEKWLRGRGRARVPKRERESHLSGLTSVHPFHWGIQLTLPDDPSCQYWCMLCSFAFFLISFSLSIPLPALLPPVSACPPVVVPAFQVVHWLIALETRWHGHTGNFDTQDRTTSVPLATSMSTAQSMNL